MIPEHRRVHDECYRTCTHVCVRVRVDPVDSFRSFDTTKAKAVTGTDAVHRAGVMDRGTNLRGRVESRSNHDRLRRSREGR